ncbi:thyrostimulin alpha-2 subunit isoform X2 [Helicoverpa zea]|uniref:thyrostimulin alpha-2 subunit isoform X2 n=1 Tax=Helicoverpa zea TaxID=7113 RepID=UPI001F5A9224|nr:thyrostimulin alpha-2 subunit isoform X2 [Helicoverpa zea]
MMTSIVLKVVKDFRGHQREIQKCHTRNISIPDCVEFKITTNACRGFCESWSLPSIMLGFKRHPVTSLGQCCNIMESEDVPVKVLCLDGERNLIFKSAVSCSCYHCQKE